MGNPDTETGGGKDRPRGGSDARRQRGLGESTLRQVGRLDIRPGPLMAILEAPPDDPDKVTGALEQSPALGARVLSVTNSAAIGVVGEISNIHRAVLHMGAGRARSIAMAFGLNMMAEESGLNPDASRGLWINSLEKAHLARLVAQPLDAKQADGAYTLGLIQDVGLSALMSIDPGFYQDIEADPQPGSPLHEREQEHFGTDHAAVGNHLLTRWNASPMLCEQVLSHHQPVLTQSDSFVVDLANLIAGMLPHDGEQMTPDRMEWLDAVHGQFLSSAYDSPDELIRAAVKAAKDVHGGAPSVRIDAAARQRMLVEIDTDTAGMVRQLCEMESLLTQKHEQVNALQFEAMTDPLTQILNRRGFDRLGERRLGSAVERGLPVCAVVIDLDGFKQVNDTFGHDAGDLILTEVAKSLRGNIDSSDLIGRLGGDEFAIFQINVNQEIARQIVKRVCDTCQGKTVRIAEGKTTEIGFSVGVATCEKPTTKTRLVELFAAADDAMYQSKRAGSGSITFTAFPGQQRAG